MTPCPKPRRRPKAKRKGLQRSGRIKAKGRPRFKTGRDPKYLEWIREQPCAVLGVYSGTIIVLLDGGYGGAVVVPAHVKTRGAGGPDQGNVVPLETRLHDEQHRIGIKSFQAKYGVNLKRIAQELAARYQRERAW